MMTLTGVGIQLPSGRRLILKHLATLGLQNVEFPFNTLRIRSPERAKRLKLHQGCVFTLLKTAQAFKIRRIS